MCFETTDAATKSTLVLIKHQVNGIHHAPRFRGEQMILFVQTKHSNGPIRGQFDRGIRQTSHPWPLSSNLQIKFLSGSFRLAPGLPDVPPPLSAQDLS